MRSAKQILYCCPQRTGKGSVRCRSPLQDEQLLVHSSVFWCLSATLLPEGLPLTLGIPTGKVDHLLNSQFWTKTIISTNVGLNYNFQSRWLQPDANFSTYGTIVTSAGSTGSVGICRLTFMEIILLSESNCPTFHCSHLNTYMSLFSTVRKLAHFRAFMHHLAQILKIRIPSHYYFLHTLSGTVGTSFGSLCLSFPICKVGYSLASLGTVKETTQFHDKKRSFQQIWGLLEEFFPCQASLIAIMPTAFQQKLFSQWYR